MLRLFEFLCLCCSVAVSVATDKAFVIVVDPTWDDTDAYVWHVPWLKDFKIIKVKTNLGKKFSYMHTHSYKSYPPADFYRQFTYNADAPNDAAAAELICPQLKSLNVSILAAIPTSDPTCALADQLAACTGALGNPAFGALATARRDKWVMGETIRKAGLRSVLEKKVSSWDEAKTFLETWEPPLSLKRPCVFKILEGVAGAGVYKIHSFEQGESVFRDILSSQSAGGNFNLMVQEFLQGREYAVDSVSRNGVHKVVAVWFEDFRQANGIFDQYFGFKLMDPEDALTKVIIEYGSKVLNALGLHNGAANTEIKFLDSEQQPCLVEVNARWAGVNWHDALAVENACVGQNQFTAAFEAYLDKDAFDRMPAVRPIKQHGAVVWEINYKDGILRSIPGLAEAKKCPSYLNHDVQVHLGKPIQPTTPATVPGTIALVNKDAAVVDADYNRLLGLIYAQGFFDVARSNAFLAERRHGDAGLAVPFLMTGAMAVGMVMYLFKREGDRREGNGTEYMAVVE